MDNYKPLATINFKAYEGEGQQELHGVKKVTLPEITHKVVTMTGAGFMGSVDVALAGMIESMDLGLEFSSAASTARLMAPGEHRLTLRAAAQVWNMTKGRQETKHLKYSLVVAPKSTKPGDLASMAESNASGQYSVYYYAAYEGDRQLWEIDPMNQIFKVDGEDYYAEIRKALGE